MYGVGTPISIYTRDFSLRVFRIVNTSQVCSLLCCASISRCIYAFCALHIRGTYKHHTTAREIRAHHVWM